jgi:NAD(P)-dependent dehydrogenase (short-subunit alcohol dehydrogenase family)
VPTIILNTPQTGLFANLQARLRAPFAAIEAPPAALLVNALADADAAIVAATEFADGLAPAQQAVVVTILQAHAQGDWPAARAAAMQWAFMRHAALAWAPRGIRVNAIGLGVSPTLPDQPIEESGRAAGPAPATAATPDDLAATIVAIWRFPSLTGQLIRLAA